MTYYFCVLKDGRHVLVQSVRKLSGRDGLPSPELYYQATSVIEFSDKEQLLKSVNVRDWTNRTGLEIREELIAAF